MLRKIREIVNRSIYPVNWQITQPKTVGGIVNRSNLGNFATVQPAAPGAFRLPNYKITRFSISQGVHAKSDRWIRKMAREHDMINPFSEKQVREGVISYGLSSYGYDLRVAMSSRSSPT